MKVYKKIRKVVVLNLPNGTYENVYKNVHELYIRPQWRQRVE